MATTVRVLCHGTAQSVSLLGQLGLTSVLFCDTGHPDRPGNMMAWFPLVSMRVSTGPAGSGFVAMLDNRPPGIIHDSTFDDWWAAIVIDDKQSTMALRMRVADSSNVRSCSTKRRESVATSICKSAVNAVTGTSVLPAP